MRHVAVLLALASLACAEEDMDALWRDACQWRVGSAVASTNAAREKLVALGSASLDYIIPAKLDTTDGLAVEAIYEVVVKIGGEAAERLMPCLDAESSNVRKITASLLGKLGCVAAVPRIAELLNDKDARGGALEALGALKAVDAVAAIADLMRTADKERARVACLGTLAAIGGDGALEVILSALSDKGAAVRFAAQFALEKMKAVDPLRARLSDPDPRVRLHAIHALGRIGDAAAREDLLALLASEDPIVRGYAAEALTPMLQPGDSDAMRARLDLETHPFARGKLVAALQAESDPKK